MYGDNQQAQAGGKLAVPADAAGALRQETQLFTAEEAGEGMGPVSTLKEQEEALLKIVGSRLVRARNANKIKPLDVAEALGHSNLTMVSLFENSRRAPSLRNLVALADAYGVTTDYLLGRTDDLELQPEEGNQNLIKAAIKGALAAYTEQFLDGMARSSSITIEAMSGDHVLLDRITELFGEVRSALSVIRKHHGAQFDELRGGSKLVRHLGEIEDTLTPRIQRKERIRALAEYEHPVCDPQRIEQAVQQLLLV